MTDTGKVFLQCEFECVAEDHLKIQSLYYNVDSDAVSGPYELTHGVVGWSIGQIHARIHYTCKVFLLTIRIILVSDNKYFGS